jgi:hypothetical protein
MSTLLVNFMLGMVSYQIVIMRLLQFENVCGEYKKTH